jgi:hypothetical protein
MKDGGNEGGLGEWSFTMVTRKYCLRLASWKQLFLAKHISYHKNLDYHDYHGDNFNALNHMKKTKQINLGHE